MRPVESVLKNDLLFQSRVIEDSDYASLTKGLTDEWKETQVFFNVKNDCYAFSKELFYEIVSSSGPEAALPDGYDRIVRKRLLSNGEEYFFDPENAEKYDIPVIQYDQPDSFVFRQNWLYMPKFRILDQSDFTTTMAVFLLLFIFISLLCFTAVGVILFTRSLTLCITNEEIYNNLKKAWRLFCLASKNRPPSGFPGIPFSGYHWNLFDSRFLSVDPGCKRRKRHHPIWVGRIWPLHDNRSCDFFPYIRIISGDT